MSFFILFLATFLIVSCSTLRNKEDGNGDREKKRSVTLTLVLCFVGRM